jgi:hypothetical protein
MPAEAAHFTCVERSLCAAFIRRTGWPAELLAFRFVRGDRGA